jgi:hypothetical protein
MDPKTAQNILVAIRLAFAAAWFTPRVAGKLFGMDPETNPQGVYLARLFSAREGMMAAQLLTAQDDELDRVLTAQIAVDVADVAASVAGGTTGYIPKRTMVMGVLTALVAAALGLLARSR